MRPPTSERFEADRAGEAARDHELAVARARSGSIASGFVAGPFATAAASSSVELRAVARTDQVMRLGVPAQSRRSRRGYTWRRRRRCPSAAFPAVVAESAAASSRSTRTRFRREPSRTSFAVGSDRPGGDRRARRARDPPARASAPARSPAENTSRSPGCGRSFAFGVRAPARAHRSGASTPSAASAAEQRAPRQQNAGSPPSPAACLREGPGRAAGRGSRAGTRLACSRVAGRRSRLRFSSIGMLAATNITVIASGTDRAPVPRRARRPRANSQRPHQKPISPR